MILIDFAIDCLFVLEIQNLIASGMVYLQKTCQRYR